MGIMYDPALDGPREYPVSEAELRAHDARQDGYYADQAARIASAHVAMPLCSALFARVQRVCMTRGLPTEFVALHSRLSGLPGFTGEPGEGTDAELAARFAPEVDALESHVVRARA